MTRSQATLVGGIILLIVLVAVVLPVVLNLVSTSTTISESVKQIAQVRLEAYREKVQVLFFANSSKAGILVNNTGTTRVIIERVILVNLTSGEPVNSPKVCGSAGICGIINIPYASNNPLVSKVQFPLYDDCKVGILRGSNPANLECLDDSGRVAVLEPGDVLYISIDPDKALKYLRNVVVYAESAYGVIHPVVTIPPNATGRGAGLPIPKEAIPTGLYTPISGYILLGYDDLVNYTVIDPLRPPYRVSTLGPYGYFTRDITYVCGGVPFRATFIYADYDHPGLFKVKIVPSTNAQIYVYTRYGWVTIPLSAGETYYIVGFVGSYGTDHPDPNTPCADNYGTDISLMVVDGWAYDIIDSSGRSLLASRYPPPSLASPAPVTGKYDIDSNGISEYTVSTDLLFLGASDPDADGGGNLYNCPWGFDCDVLDDTLAMRYIVLRDITGVDAISVSVKAVYYWVSRFYSGWATTAWKLRPLPAVGIGLLRLDPVTYEWRLIYLKTYEVTKTKPQQIWLSATFPTNKTDVYRIIVLVYDPYGWPPMTENGVVSWCTDTWRGYCIDWRDYPFSEYDFTVSLEHIIVQYYVYNPLLKKIPVVYLVNITGVPYWPDGYNTGYGRLGYLNETALKNYWDTLVSRLQSMGIYPIVINNWEIFKKLLGGRDAPRDAVVVFLHGPILPWQDGLSLYDPLTDSYMTIYTPQDMARWLAYMARGRGWVVVTPYGPPMAFTYDTASGRLEFWPGGDVLNTLLQSLRPDLAGGINAEYLFVAVNGFERLENYTVGMGSDAYNATRKLRFWLVPRLFTGNYSIISTTAGFYDVTHPLWLNETPPPGYLSWPQLGVPSGGYALGAGYITDPTVNGALVIVAAPRPGAVDPARLAGLDILASVYVWLKLQEAKG